MLSTALQIFRTRGEPISSFKEFLTDHDLQTGDLPELGNAQVVEEILDGEREFTHSQIRVLSERFGVSALVFI